MAELLENRTIGWIGLGKMGRPMSLRILRAGARVIGHNRSRAVLEEMGGRGLEAAASPRDVAQNAEIIVLTLFDASSVRDVLRGEVGLLAGLRLGTLVVDMGTTDVESARQFARDVADAGGSYLDAPVSGGTRGAADGNLTIMVGGAAADVQRAMPIFSILGDHVTHIGPAGAGQVAKAANQVVVGLTIVAVAEALALAWCAGVDLRKTREAIEGGFADSRILREHGLRMIEQNFEPGARIAIQRKDMEQALSLAESLGLKLPATAHAAERFQIAAERGFDQLDQSAVFKILSVRHS